MRLPLKRQSKTEGLRRYDNVRAAIFDQKMNVDGSPDLNILNGAKRLNGLNVLNGLRYFVARGIAVS
jgi:hypothetical protein